MIKVKKERLEELEKLGFEKRFDLFYVKKMRVSLIRIDRLGKFCVMVNESIFDDFMSEITYISNILLSDRYGVNITIDILREKGMLEDE